MATILLGWEIGGGFGHVGPLLTVARQLAARGHKPVFAMRNVGDCWSVIRKEGFPVLQAPYWQDRDWRLKEPFRARSFSDILAYYAWEDPTELEGMLRAWDALIDLVKPSLIIVDHAPALLLAAYRTIPTVRIGTGFTLPPHNLPEFPVVNPHAKPLLSDKVLLDSIVEAQRRRGRPAPPSVPALFADGPGFITTFSEFDPYRTYRPGTSVGPFDPPSDPVPMPAEPRWFAYFAADWTGTAPVLTELVKTGIPGAAFLRSSNAELRGRLRAAGLPILEERAVLKDLLPRISVIVHHAGATLGGEAMAAGRPQLLLPSQLEQWLTSETLKEAGLALIPSQQEPAGASLLRLVKGEMFANAAQAKAQWIRDHGPWDALAKTVTACEEALSGSR